MTASSNAHEFEAIEALIDQVREYIDGIQQPRTADRRWSERVRAVGDDLAGRIAAFTAGAGPASSLEKLRELADRMRAYSDTLAESPNVQALKERKERLARSYEELLLELKKRHAERAAALGLSRQLKPTNYVRNLFHMSNGVIAFTLYHFVLTRESALMVLGTIFSVFFVLEVTRRFSTRWNDFLVDKVFGSISRPSERYRTNSATLYLLALIIITWFFPKVAVEAAVLVLGFSDPIASLVGKRWGRRKLFRDKSWAGTLGFFFTGLISVGALLLLTQPALGVAAGLGIAAGIAAAGAVTELLSSRVDDNLSIPLVCAAVGALLL